MSCAPALWSLVWMGWKVTPCQCECWKLSARTLTCVSTSDLSLGLIPPASFTSMPRKAEPRPVPKSQQCSLAAQPPAPPLACWRMHHLGLRRPWPLTSSWPLLCLLKTLQLGAPLPRNSSAILMWQIALENSVPSPSAFRLTQSAYSVLGPQQQGLSFSSPTLQQTLKPCLAFSCLAWAQLQWEWMTQLSMMK